MSYRKPKRDPLDFINKAKESIKELEDEPVKIVEDKPLKEFKSNKTKTKKKVPLEEKKRTMVYLSAEVEKNLRKYVYTMKLKGYKKVTFTSVIENAIFDYLKKVDKSK